MKMKREVPREDEDGPSKRAHRSTDLSTDLSTDKKTQCMSVLPLERFSGRNPNFRQPAEIGSFSLDGQRTFHNDARQLRYYTPPKDSKGLSFDLKVGYASAVLRDENVKEKLDHLLMWIEQNQDKFQVNPIPSLSKGVNPHSTTANGVNPPSTTANGVNTSSSSSLGQENDSSSQDDLSSGQRISIAPSISAPQVKSLNTDFVAWRGHFTKILTSPYEHRDAWMMAANRVNGTIFLSELETEKSVHDRQTRSARNKEMCYWGYKFEDYVTQPVQGSVQPCAAEVNTNEAYCTVTRTRLNTHSIVMGAEVDCCVRDDDETAGTLTRCKRLTPPSNYIELKTTRLMQSERQRETYARFKLMKFWAQSFLSGIPSIIVGMRDDSGIVRELESLETLRIPSSTRRFTNVREMWDSTVCLNFLDQFLTMVKRTLPEDSPDDLYIFSFDERSRSVSVEKSDDPSLKFLPEWFTKGRL